MNTAIRPAPKQTEDACRNDHLGLFLARGRLVFRTIEPACMERSNET